MGYLLRLLVLFASLAQECIAESCIGAELASQVQLSPVLLQVQNHLARGERSLGARVAETSIWLDSSPLLTPDLEEQAAFCKSYPQKSWDAERMQAGIEIVRNITKAFRKAGIPPMIMTGTLLSYYRQGFLINGDADIDFWVPRQFVRTPKLWSSFVRGMAESNITCMSVFQEFAAGWKIACYPADSSPRHGWKLKAGDKRGFYMDVSVVDEGIDGCTSPPCRWTEYLTYQNKTYPGVFGPFNWRLASWHNFTVWVPSDPKVPLVQLYSTKWNVPAGGGAGYHHWLQNTPLANGTKLSYFKDILDLRAPAVLELQERLEKDNAEQIAQDAQKQWNVAMVSCVTDSNETKSSFVDQGTDDDNTTDLQGKSDNGNDIVGDGNNDSEEGK